MAHRSTARSSSPFAHLRAFRIHWILSSFFVLILVVLPTRNTTRPDNKNIERDVATRVLRDDTSLSRWSPASWLNLLLEKHAWLSAGLVWMHGASESGIKGVFEDSGPDGLESRPTINLFEQWEEGAHLPKLVNARNYSSPQPLVVPFTWMHAPRVLPLSEAVNYVSLNLGQRLTCLSYGS